MNNDLKKIVKIIIHIDFALFWMKRDSSNFKTQCGVLISFFKMCSLLQHEFCRDILGLIRDFLSEDVDYYKKEVMEETLYLVRFHYILYYESKRTYYKSRRTVALELLHSYYKYVKKMNRWTYNYQGPLEKDCMYGFELVRYPDSDMFDFDVLPYHVHVMCHYIVYEEGFVLLKLVIAF